MGQWEEGPKVGCDILTPSFGVEKSSTRRLDPSPGREHAGTIPTHPGGSLHRCVDQATCGIHPIPPRWLYLLQARRSPGFDCSKSLEITLKDKGVL